MEDVDEVLYCWFKQARAMSANISGNILMEKAKHKLEVRIKNNLGVQSTLSKLSNTYLVAH